MSAYGEIRTLIIHCHPGDIPDVRPWQPGLREAWRFSLTAVSPGLMLLKMGPNVSCVGPLWTAFGWKRGRRGCIHITTQCRPDRNLQTVEHQNKVPHSTTPFFWTSSSSFLKILVQLSNCMSKLSSCSFNLEAEILSCKIVRVLDWLLSLKGQRSIQISKVSLTSGNRIVPFATWQNWKQKSLSAHYR